MSVLKYTRRFRALGIGSTLGIGFITPYAWPLGLIGIAWFFITAQKTKNQLTYSEAWLAWTTRSALALVWFWYVYPIEWLAFELGSLQVVLIFFYWITSAMWLGVGGVVALFLTRYWFRSLSHPVLQGSALAVSWVIAEIVGSLIFSVITIGQGGIITSAFSFGFIGYLLAEHSLLIFASLVAGVYGLGLLAVGIGYLLFFFQKYIQKRLPLMFLIFGVVYTSGFISVSAPETIDGYSVVTIDTEFPPNRLRTPEGAELIRQNQLDAFTVALAEESDYVLWPEDARALQLPISATNTSTIIVDSTRVDTPTKTYLEAQIQLPESETVEYSHKRYLVPQGEFMPSLYSGALTLLGFDELVTQVAREISYEVGPKTSQSDFSERSPGILFCFESVSPYGVQAVLADREAVPFIAHPVSHSWFHEPKILWSNLDRMLQVQAVWAGKYIVSVGTNVRGSVYTPYGSVEPLDVIEHGDGWTVNQTIIPYE